MINGINSISAILDKLLEGMCILYTVTGDISPFKELLNGVTEDC